MIKIIFFIALLIVTISCGEKKNFSTSEMGLEYRFKELGDEEFKVKQGNYALLNIDYLTAKDSVFYSSKAFKLDHFDHVRLENKSTCKFQNLLSDINVGDSISAKIIASDFFATYLESELPSFLSENEELTINFRLNEHLSVVEHEKFIEEQKDLYEMKELLIIDDFVSKDTNFIAVNGVFIKTFRDSVKVDSLNLSYGQSFYLNYEGRFLDNENLFYSTYRNGYPDEFNYGIKGQLIEGLMIGLSGSQKGDSLIIVIPSLLGFGNTYSAGNIVPPYSPLIYNLKIEKSYTIDSTLLN